MYRRIRHWFSGNLVRESLAEKINRCGNLTGNVRIIRDNVAEIYNSTQNWNKHVLSGAIIVSKLRDIKLNRKSGVTDENDKNVRAEFCKLDDVCDELMKCLNRLEICTSSLIAVTELEKARSNDEPLFLTWPVNKFEEICKKIYTSFAAELDLKIAIKKQIGFANNESELHFLVVSWINEPYIGKQFDQQKQAMLIETGLLENSYLSSANNSQTTITTHNNR